MTISDRARRLGQSRTRLAFAALVVALAVGVFATSMRSAVAEIRWPVRISYSTVHLAEPTDTSGLAEEQFEFTGSSWREWTNRPLGRDAGTCWQRRSDGRLYEGPPDCTAMRPSGMGKSAEGGAPNPWLNGRPLAQYEQMGYEQVPLQRGREVAGRLGVREADLIELRIEKIMTCAELGYLECRSDSGGPLNYSATVVLDRVTALPLLNEEVLGELILSRYVVDEVEAMPEYRRPRD